MPSCGCSRELITMASVNKISRPHFPNDFDFDLTNNTYQISVYLHERENNASNMAMINNCRGLQQGLIKQLGNALTILFLVYQQKLRFRWYIKFNTKQRAHFIQIWVHNMMWGCERNRENGISWFQKRNSHEIFLIPRGSRDKSWPILIQRWSTLFVHDLLLFLKPKNGMLYFDRLRRVLIIRVFRCRFNSPRKGVKY